MKPMLGPGPGRFFTVNVTSGTVGICCMGIGASVWSVATELGSCVAEEIGCTDAKDCRTLPAGSEVMRGLGERSAVGRGDVAGPRSACVDGRGRRRPCGAARE